MSDKQSIRQKFRANITASGSTGVQGGTEYPVHGEAQVRVQTSGFGGTNVVAIQVKIFDGDWSTLDSVTGNADSGALDVSAWDFVRFNVTTADGTGAIVASGFFSKAQPAGGGASASFTIVQADSGTSPTATGATDTLTVTGTGGIATSGDATTDTVTVTLNINGLTADASPDGAADYVVTYDASAGANKKVLLNNLPGGGGGSGDVVGPASSTDNAIARFDSTTGKLIQNSGAILADNGLITSMNTTYTGSTGYGTGITIGGDRTVAIGNTVTTNQWSVLIGYSINASAYQRCVGIGYSQTFSGTSGVGVGYNISNIAQGSVCVGSGSSASSTLSVAIGSTAATSSSSGNIAIGDRSVCSSTSGAGVALGQLATASGQGAFALGPSSSATGNFSVVIGNGATAAHASSAAIGPQATTTAVNQLVVGGYSAGAGGFNDVYIGYGVTSTTVNNLTVRATGRSGTNLTGVNHSIYAGQGTGTGVGGSLYLGTSKAGTTGSTLNGVTNYLQVSSNGVIINPSFDSTGDFRIEGVLGYTMSFWDASTGYITHYMDNVIYQDTSSVKMLELETGKRVYQGAAATAPTSGNMFNGSICFYLDESGNNLKATVKYSDGTVKTFTAAVV